MKNQFVKLFVALALMLFAFQSQAQFLVGGSVGYTNSNYESDDSERNSERFRFSPEIGVALKPNVLLGFRYTFSRSIETYDNEITKGNWNYYSIFNRLRKPLNDVLNLYGEIEFTYQHSKFDHGLTTLGTPVISDSQELELSLAPGLEFKINEKWMLNARWGILAYQHSLGTYYNNDRNSNNLVLELKPANISIGLNYLFDLE